MDFSFSTIKETRYEDLSTPFASLMNQESSIDHILDELILFYRVKDLEQFQPTAKNTVLD